jgi:hypothetical protein
VVPKYTGAEKRAFSSHWPSFFTYPRSKVASLAGMASLAGIEVASEVFAFVRFFDGVD